MRKKAFALIVVMVVSLFAQGFFTTNTVNAATSNNNATKEENINKVYKYSKEDISTDENGDKYLNNIVTLIFKADVSKDKISEVVKSINGEIVGEISDIDKYQVKIEKSSLTEIEAINDKLMKEFNDVLLFSGYESEVKEASVVQPNDPWGEGSIWNKKDPSQNSWYLDAIDAPSAWQYNDLLKDEDNKIKIGILEGGYETTHEDFPDNYTILDHTDGNATDTFSINHGTGVVGVIAAKANNNIGITGMVWNPGELLLAEEDDYTSGIVSSIVDLVKHGAKVINLSLNSGIRGEESAILIAKLVNEGYDFIAVQAAGNIPGTDSRYNGLFASIDKATCEKVAKEFDMDPEEIEGRHIVAAAMTNKIDGYYRYTGFSCGGETVDIAAPGCDIYTLGANNSYQYIDGTSFATPLTVSVAALVWKANTNLTGPEVKNIICSRDNVKDIVKEKDGEECFGDCKVLNAKLAIEAALRTKDNNNTTTIYYSGYNNPNIHYQIGNGSWTSVPGVKMEASSDKEGYPYKAVIDLREENTLTACFNDGNGNWDSNNGKNYTFEKGVYTYSNGVITKLGNSNNNEFKVVSIKADKASPQSVGSKINLSTDVKNAKGYVTYIYKIIRESGEEVELYRGSRNSVIWTPSFAGTYVLKVIAKDSQGNASSAAIFRYVVSDKVDDNKAVIYYEGYTNPFIHYSIGENNWIVAPGVKMDRATDVEGYSHKKTIDLGQEGYVVACFNDGNNNWDNNNGQDYKITSGTWYIKNGVVSKDPITSNKTTIYYKAGYATPYIHYKVGNGSWTSVPGVMMSKSSNEEGYYEITIDLGDSNNLTACFNDGNGNWDSNYGNNYVFTSGKYYYYNGRIQGSKF